MRRVWVIIGILGDVYELLSREKNYEPSIAVVESVRIAFRKQQSLRRCSKVANSMTLVPDNVN